MCNMIKTAIFDYNGTLYKDDDINDYCWKETIFEIDRNFKDFDNFFKKYKSSKNSIIVSAVKQASGLSKLNEEYWINKKEEKYRERCTLLKRSDMADGAEQLLNYLKDKNIEIFLCTASIKSNVDFYYKLLNLNRWFSMDKTIYDSGEYENKKQMYEACFTKYKLNPKETIVFEDSAPAIESLVQIGCDNIIEIINQSKSQNTKEVKQTIHDFTELDYSLIEIE